MVKLTFTSNIDQHYIYPSIRLSFNLYNSNHLFTDVEKYYTFSIILYKLS